MDNQSRDYGQQNLSLPHDIVPLPSGGVFYKNKKQSVFYMRKDNLEHGVWGGVMAGERLVAAGVPILGFDRSKKITFANKVRNRIKFNEEERYEK